jgi:hypothetical protein
MGLLYLLHYTIPRPLPRTILPFQLLNHSIIRPSELSNVSLYIDKCKPRIFRHTYNGSTIFLKHPIVGTQLAICSDLSHKPRFGSCNTRGYDLLFVEWLRALLQAERPTSTRTKSVRATDISVQAVCERVTEQTNEIPWNRQRPAHLECI